MRQLPEIAVLLVSCAALAGCGGEAPAAKSAAPIEHGIFISASDCAETNKLTIDECGAAIDSAVAENHAQAQAFNLLEQCEQSFGVDRCDKGVDGRYRVRVQAFFVTLARPAHAVALYPPTKSMIGFQSPSRQPIDARDETLRVSEASLALAHENATLSTSGPDQAQALGAAASDIH